MRILVTGGAGFIGGNFVQDWLRLGRGEVVNLDKLTYAGNVDTLAEVMSDSRHVFVRGDIGDGKLIADLLERYRPTAVVHFAAESHVDRSILGPEEFIQTNIVGTFRLLEATRKHWSKHYTDGDSRQGGGTKSSGRFRFLHVSTDEVYGTLAPDEPAFRETNRYSPNSPYAASKAASDHLVRAYYHTYGLPILLTNCSNNYGPYHFPEKLIPLIIVNALEGKSLPVYGDGMQIRDWLYVKDHCSALRRVLDDGSVGETYNIGGWNERPNIDVVRAICALLDSKRPRLDGRSYATQIAFVADRPGHDRRYAIDATKLASELGWTPSETFESGLEKTVDWYLENQAWVSRVKTGDYRAWIRQQYGEGGQDGP